MLYVGTQAIAQIHQKGQTPSTSTIAHSAHMDFFQNLAVDLDTEGKTFLGDNKKTTQETLFFDFFTMGAGFQKCTGIEL